MTPTEINIAIAESLGWKRLPSDFNWGWWKHPDNETVGNVNILPNYHADLNACAEFERGIDNGYYGVLYEVCNLGFEFKHTRTHWDYADCGFASATPLQRCEAYLRVKGLWKE
jgi:hypothetical protein